MARKGWTKLPGSSERYLSPDGREVSRRQYDNERAREAGFANRSEFENRYKDPKWRWAVENLAQAEGKTRRQIDRIGSRETEMIRKAQRTSWGRTPAGRRPEGDMGRLLVAMGLRDPSDSYPVGETQRRR